MKFTKEEAIKALEAKIPTKDKDLDLSRTIREAVDNGCEMVGDESEIELDSFVNIAYKSVRTAIGLAHKENSNVAARMQEQIAELQKQLNTMNGSKETKEVDAEMKSLLDRIKVLEDDKVQSEKANAIQRKREELSSLIVNGGVKDKDWVSSMIAEISISENTDVESKSKDLIALYNKFSAKSPTTSTPKRSGGETNNSYVKDTLEKARQLMQQKDAIMGASPVKTTTV